MKAEHLNNRIKNFAWGEITSELFQLLELGVIAVTEKRFWIRDEVRAMILLNQR